MEQLETLSSSPWMTNNYNSDTLLQSVTSNTAKWDADNHMSQ